MNKQSLRQKAKDIRCELDMAGISAVLMNKLVQTSEYKTSKNIMLFYPLQNEVNLLSILEDNTKQFYLPRINEKELECCPYCMGDELCESKFRTLEPTCKACKKTNIDLVIVPALACDKKGYRLGYGGGYYDRFLKDLNAKKICCIPSELVFETVFPQEYDIKMDLILHS